MSETNDKEIIQNNDDCPTVLTPEELLALSYECPEEDDGEETEEDDVHKEVTNDTLGDQGNSSDGVLEEEISDSVNDDLQRGHLGYNPCDAPGAPKTPKKHKVADNIKGILIPVKINEVDLGRVRCVGETTRVDLLKLFIEIRTRYSVDLQLRGNHVFGTPVPMDIENQNYARPILDQEPEACGSRVCPPSSQLERQREKADTGDCEKPKQIQKPVEEDIHVKPRSSTSKRAKDNDKSTVNKKKNRKERLAWIKCKHSWITTATRSSHPKTFYDLIEKDKLKPTDEQLLDASRMSCDDLKALRLSIIMKVTTYWEAASKEAKNRYVEDLKIVKGKK